MSGDIIYISSKYRPKNDPISREIHIWYKLKDDETKQYLVCYEFNDWP